MGIRHLQIFFGWSATTIGYILRADMPVAILAMTEYIPQDEQAIDNGAKWTFDWNEDQKQYILSSLFWLYMVPAIPSGRLAEKYGAKLILGYSVLLASIFTLLIPLLSIYYRDFAFPIVLILRILNGLAQSAIYPATNVLISRWVTPQERSRSLAICFSGGFFGPLIGFPLAGYMVGSRFGWPSVFCATGGLGIVWTFMWMCYGNSSYEDSEDISDQERAYIREAIQHDVKIERASRTPWDQIFTSLPVWAIVFSHFSFNYGYFFVLTQSPTYLYYVLGVDVKSSGLLTTVPYAVGCIALPLYSFIAHAVTKHVPISPTAQRKLWNTITLWGGAFPLLLLGILDKQSAGIVILLLTLCITLLTAEYYAYLTNHIHLSPNFSGTLLGISNFVATFGSLLPPLVIGYFVPDQKTTSAEDWQYMFYVVAGIMFVGNLIYIIFGSSELQSWNEVGQGPSPSTDRGRRI